MMKVKRQAHTEKIFSTTQCSLHIYEELMQINKKTN